MKRKISRRRVAWSLALSLAALTTAAGPAYGPVVRPFRIVGAGVGPNGLPLPGQPARRHWIVGNATYLGRHTGAGAVQTNTADVDMANGRITGEFGSGAGQPFVFHGQHHERLVCYYGRTDAGADEPGTYTLTVVGQSRSGGLIVKARWVAEFVPVPWACTGRFAGVTGSWTMYADSAPFVLGSNAPVSYSWHGEGYLAFRR